MPSVLTSNFMNAAETPHRTAADTGRIRTLEAAIWEAAAKLEQTKRSFKSRQIKEIREKLLSVVNSC